VVSATYWEIDESQGCKQSKLEMCRNPEGLGMNRGINKSEVSHLKI